MREYGPGYHSLDRTFKTKIFEPASTPYHELEALSMDNPFSRLAP